MRPHHRDPKGIPAGGRFAVQEHPEPELNLAPEADQLPVPLDRNKDVRSLGEDYEDDDDYCENYTEQFKGSADFNRRVRKFMGIETNARVTSTAFHTNAGTDATPETYDGVDIQCGGQEISFDGDDGLMRLIRHLDWVDAKEKPAESIDRVLQAPEESLDRWVLLHEEGDDQAEAVKLIRRATEGKGYRHQKRLEYTRWNGGGRVHSIRESEIIHIGDATDAIPSLAWTDRLNDRHLVAGTDRIAFEAWKEYRQRADGSFEPCLRRRYGRVENEEDEYGVPEYPSHTVDMTQQTFEEAAGYIHEVPLRSNLLDYCSRLEEPVDPEDRDEIARHTMLARAEFLEEPRNGQYFHDEEAARRQLEFIMRNAPAQTLRTAGN